ncbi:MAG: hypothetical protein Q4A54_12995 [Parabacteroides sp.]|nr:hypothetical protein [Parabacteroides sp.]
MKKRYSRYSDIIDLPHHQSEYRIHMPVSSRAAQFAPFAALSGYEEMVKLTTDIQGFQGRKILDEDERELLDYKFQTVKKHISEKTEIKIKYFDRFANHIGGEYVIYTGIVKKIVEYPFKLIMEDGKKIDLSDVIDIDGKIFDQEKKETEIVSSS